MLEHLVSDMEIFGLFHVVLIVYRGIAILEDIILYWGIATLLFDIEI